MDDSGRMTENVKSGKDLSRNETIKRKQNRKKRSRERKGKEGGYS
jgi:hypothetical protein